MVRRTIVGLAVALIVTMAPAAVGAGGGEPDPGVLYESDGKPAVQLVTLPGPGGRVLVEMQARFNCGDLRLSGVVLAKVKRDGSFAKASDAFVHDEGGTDITEVEAEVRGRFRGSEVTGTITAEGRTYDNAGTTGECDDELDWDAEAADEAQPGSAQVQATIPLGDGFGFVAATDDAAYVLTEPGDEGARLVRIDAATNEVAWKTTPAAGDALTATSDSVWTVDGENNRVLRFDAATGEPTAEIELAPSGTETLFSIFASIAATDDAVWVAAPGNATLYRIDRATNEVSPIALGAEGIRDALVAATPTTVYIGLELDAEVPDDAPGNALRLAAVDAGTATVVTSADTFGQIETMTADTSGLWVLLLFGDGLARFDPGTLAEGERIDVEGGGLALAPPGVWVSTVDGLVAYDATTSAVEVPLIGGADGKLAAATGVLWVWDPRVSALTRLEVSG